MTRIKSFEDIEAWTGARALTKRIYELAGSRPLSSDFALKNQICRACVSSMSNIAEGYESDSPKTFIRYLRIAKGSAGEVRSELCVAVDQGLVSRADFDLLSDKSRKIAAQLANLVKYLRSRP